MLDLYESDYMCSPCTVSPLFPIFGRLAPKAVSITDVSHATLRHSSRSFEWFMPIRVATGDESYASPEESPFAVDPSTLVDVVEGNEEVDADTGDMFVCPKALPTPIMPSPAIVARHNLTHVPYRSWCPYCNAGRRPNSQHRGQSVDQKRSLPVVHADYCFIRDTQDEDNLTVCVGRMSPSKAMFASGCTVKGAGDDYVLGRLENFL